MYLENMMPDSLPPSEPVATNKRFAVLEIFGQKRIAGAIREVLHGGTPFLRIDVPAVSFDDDAGTTVVIPGHAHDLRPVHVYCIDWVDGAVADEVAHLVKHRPSWMCEPSAPMRGALRDLAAPKPAEDGTPA